MAWSIAALAGTSWPMQLFITSDAFRIPLLGWLQFQPQHIANTSWAVATMVFFYAQLCNAVWGIRWWCGRTFGPRSLAFTAWAVATLVFTHCAALCSVAYFVTRWMSSVVPGASMLDVCWCARCSWEPKCELLRASQGP